VEVSPVVYHKAWEVGYQRDRAAGRRRYVDAEDTRARLAGLLESGVPLRAVARAAGLSGTGVAAIVDKSRRSVQRATADRVAQVTLREVSCGQAGGHVPRVGAVRRVQALLAMGWRHKDLAAAGAQHTAGLLCGDGDLVTAQRWRQVRDVYEALSMAPGPSARTRARAHALGYAPPLAWDEETIDDPAARPQGQARRGTGPDVVDAVAVDRAVGGVGVVPPLTVAERREAVRALAAAGVSDVRIGARLQVSDRTVLRIRRRDAIPAGRPRAAPPPADAEWTEARGATGTGQRPNHRERPVAMVRPAALIPAR
jgi:lambda repressor-like predicted transcriptional regulator